MRREFDVIIICQLFYPELVSTGQTLTELVEELSKLGLKIMVIAAQPTILGNSEKVPKIITYNGITIYRTWSTRLPKIYFWGKFFNLFSFFLSSSLYVLFKQKKTHILLLTNPPYLPLLGWLNYTINKTEYGVLLFDIMPEQAELLSVIKKDGLISKVWKKLNKIWYKYASYIIVLSKDMLEGAIENSNLNNSKFEKIYREKTKIIHVWSDDRVIQKMKKCDSKLANDLNYADKFIIQYSGNHGRFHDIETLLGIIDQLSDKDEILFQFIGEGFKKRLVEEFKNFKKIRNIFISTYISKELLSDSLAMADIGIVAQLPGQERVCYPSKLFGIMASGRPVLAICPKNTEMAKMIIENNLGFVIENGDIKNGVDTILFAKKNRKLLKEMGENSYNYLKKYFTLDNASKKYYKLIKLYC